MSDFLESKAIILLKSISENEKKYLTKYISTYGSGTLNNLYTYIEKFSPQYNDANFTYKKTSKKIYGSNAPSQNSLSTLLSKLFSLIEDFIILYENELHFNCLNENNGNEDAQLEQFIIGHLAKLKYYNDRQLIPFFNKCETKLEEAFAAYPIKNRFYYTHLLEFERQRFFFIGRYRDERKGDINFNSQMDVLDKQFLLEKMMLLCHMLNRQQITGTNFHLELMDLLIAYFPNSIYKEDKELKLWYTVLLLLKNIKSIESFHFIKHSLLQKEIILDVYDSRIVFTFLQNLAKQNTLSDEDYYNTLFDIYKYQIEEEIMQKTKTLLPVQFLNIVTIGLRLKEFKWVNVFITDLENAIIVEDEDEKQMVKDVAYLDYYIATKDLIKLKKRILTIDIFKEIRLKDVKNNTAIRRNMIKGYYELNEDDLVLDSINTYKRFITYHQTEINEPFNTANKKFISYLNKLLVIDKFNGKEKELEIDKLINKIALEKVVYDKSWLIDKLEEKRNIVSRIENKQKELKKVISDFSISRTERFQNIKFEYKQLLENQNLPYDIKQKHLLFLDSL